MLRRALSIAVAAPIALLGAALAADDTAVADPDAGSPPPEVLEVTGDDVNLRSGPSVNFKEVGRLSRGALVVAAGRDGDFVRVRVPGGVCVHVFAELLAHEPGALHCVVDADDVLMRPTPATAYLALHEQRLQRGERLVVLGVEETASGTWLAVATPPRVHVWMHGAYLRPAGGDVSETRLEALARTRLDALSDGRTRRHRERLAAERLAREEQRLGELRAAAEESPVSRDVETAARALSAETADADLRRRAESLAARVAAARRAAEVALRRAEEERARAEEARRREAEADAEREAEEAQRRARLGSAAAVGVIRIREGLPVLEVDGGPVLDLTSSRLRLRDHRDHRVRVWGHRHVREDTRDRLEVIALEVLRDAEAP